MSDKPSKQVGPAASTGAVAAPKSRPGAFLDTLSKSAKGQFAIALDASGSMERLIDAARVSIGEIIQRVVAEAGRPIAIRLYAYRDYDCLGSQFPVLEQSELTADVSALQRWLGQREATGGGGNDGEAVEAALADVLQRQEADAVLVAGDEPSNSKQHLRGGATATAYDLAARLKERNCPVHMFALGGSQTCIADFKKVSAASGGKFGRLDGGPDMIDMAVLAMLSRLKGAAAVQRYVEGRALTDNAKSFATALLPKPDEKK
jgi:hypothetical protein